MKIFWEEVVQLTFWASVCRSDDATVPRGGTFCDDFGAVSLEFLDDVVDVLESDDLVLVVDILLCKILLLLLFVDGVKDDLFVCVGLRIEF